MINKHSNETLIKLYSEKPYQGAAPDKAKYLFISEDANFAPDIDKQPIFPRIIEYLQDGVEFWRTHGVHHPFLLPNYPQKGAGRTYHENFAKIGFQPSDAAKISFIGLLDVPTIGGKLTADDFNAAHLKYLDELICSGKERYVFAPARVAKLIYRTGKFPYVNVKREPQGCYEGIEVWATIGETKIFKILNFSTHSRSNFRERGAEEMEKLRNLFGLNR